MRKLITVSSFSLLFLCCATLSWSAQPKLVLLEPIFNFGTVAQGEKVEHAFPIHNAGTGPLTIINIKTSCGCTVAETSTEKLAPGETGEIRVQFDSSKFRDDIRKKIYLYSDAPENPVGQMLLVGRVRELIEFSPRRVLVQARDSELPLKYQITLENKSKATVGLKGAKSSSETLDVSLSVNKLSPGETGILEITTTQGKTPPPEKMRIEVYTDLENLPQLVIPVQGVVNRETSPIR